MLSRILGIGLLLSFVANGVTASLYFRAKAETQTLVSEAALAANQHWKATAFEMDAAHQAEVAELRSRLALSDQVTKDALRREVDAAMTLEQLQSQLRLALANDPSYKAWAETQLPVGVADRLRSL